MFIMVYYYMFLRKQETAYFITLMYINDKINIEHWTAADGWWLKSSLLYVVKSFGKIIIKWDKIKKTVCALWSRTVFTNNTRGIRAPYIYLYSPMDFWPSYLRTNAV